eukprot:CAMPEP_0201147704 /NCGR_PEP_ID=MMETSP0851-20130426/9237_1 /ASSEMBLY_ACC=CAM_ASM_000631 /TAXON_ID=183588 /ORGANISM="Pseudo-nitzschia fraudulenta, Strain WWA7" /LENGTH=585 /DNA_ID=CAMNT_0047423631 /DNA_START=5 /DNA_END=1762 /DNA_ORIENTATION=-
MTLELVRDMTIVKKNDEVLTAYGTGKLLTRKGEGGSMEIKLPFGAKLYHRQPELVHKVLSPDDYENAMEHLEQVRKLGLAAQSQQWSVPIMDEVCVPCLFDKPYCRTSVGTENSKTIASQNAKNMSKAAMAKRKNRRTWFGRFSSASTSTVVSKSNVAAPVSKERNGMLTKKRKTTRTKFCDVCGNPVCTKHIIPAAGGQQFRMCVDCQFDFSQMFETTSSDKMTQSGINSNLLDLDHIPQLTQTLDRLLTYYTRMVLHLTFCTPNLKELAERLTSKERTNSKIALGTGGISFVGAALGVAGTAALFTPAGPALLLAAVATSASSAAIQGGHAGYNALLNMSLKEANQLADRIIGWHGLCLGILDALDQLRQTLLQQVLAIAQKNRYDDNDNVDDDVDDGDGADGKNADADNDSQQKNSNRQKQQEKDALLLQQVLNSRSHSGSKSTSEQSMEVLNTLALGSYHTTRHGLTGVGLTASMGASYSQMINASIQTVPVVGGAFSLGCMAMDASNIASTLQKLQKPSSKAVALHKVEDSFMLNMPATIQGEVEALLGAINDLKERQQEAQRNQQQDLIEQELEELHNI